MHANVRHSFLSLWMVAIVAGGAWVPCASAELVPPTLRRDIGAYALYGRSFVKLNGASAMPRRGSTGSEALVEFPALTLANGDKSWVAAPSVVARAASQLHFVFASSLDASPDVVIDHAPAGLDAPLVAAADFPRLPVVACNSNDISVDRTISPLTLAPGRYGNVSVEQDQTMILAAGGRYEFCSVRVRAGATVEAHTGTFVLIRDFLTTDAHSRITGDGACGARWIALGNKLSPPPGAAGFEFVHRNGPADRTLVEGNFFSRGRISMGQNIDYTGRFWAETIEGFGVEPVARTISDCQAPQCGDGVLDPGEGCDDGNNLDGDCCSSFCEVLEPGALCDDGRFCTAVDVCDSNARCVGSGDPCDAPDGDANCSESCNEDTNACNAPDPDSTRCDDGLYCNGSDLCASGACIAHTGAPCPGPDDDANCRESCDEATHACNTPDPVGAPCNDGKFCTLAETCQSDGTCSGGAPRCPGADSDGDCAESCDELADSCTAADPESSPCDDGLFCTATDRCDGSGQCRGWGDVCAAAAGDGDANCAESCDEASRSCTAPDHDGAPCSDGLECTLGERCIAGACAPGGRTSCDDFNPCTDEFCAPDGACLREYNSVSCDDGNPCTTGDRCVVGTCSGTGTVDCRDDDLCSTDICDPADGTCHHSYAPAEDCHVAGSSSTRIRLGYSREGESEARLSTMWRGSDDGDVTAREEIGELGRGDAFAVCFYDESSGLPELAYRLDLDDSTLESAAWRRKANFFELLYKLKTTVGTTQGVSEVRIGVDDDGVPKFTLKAGANPGCKDDCRAKFLAPATRPDGRLFTMEPAMTVQWTSSTGACWSSRYERAAVNTGASFQARTRR